MHASLFSIDTKLDKWATSYMGVCFELHTFKVIDNLSQVIDFYWSINSVWHVGGSAIVDGLLLKGSWFTGRRFFCPLPAPLPSLTLSTLNPVQT